MAPHSSAVKLPSRAAAMGAHRWPHAIAKGPPRKIRIVHVVEPTVIKTDARQFRELVQRLTGKPPNGVSGGAVVGASCSSSSGESASADSSSRAATGSSSSDLAVVVPALAVKAEVKEEEEEMGASPEEEGFARACGEVLGDTNGGATTATVKAEVEEEDVTASPEKEDVAGSPCAFGEVDDTYDAFFHGLDDFLLGAFQADGFSL